MFCGRRGHLSHFIDISWSALVSSSSGYVRCSICIGEYHLLLFYVAHSLIVTYRLCASLDVLSLVVLRSRQGRGGRCREWDLGLNEDTRKKKRSCAVTLTPSPSLLLLPPPSPVPPPTPKREHTVVLRPRHSENDGGRLRLSILCRKREVWLVLSES